jgi:hypothetical protein
MIPLAWPALCHDSPFSPVSDGVGAVISEEKPASLRGAHRATKQSRPERSLVGARLFRFARNDNAYCRSIRSETALEIVARSERLLRMLTQPEAPCARACSGHPRLGNRDGCAGRRRGWPGRAWPRYLRWFKGLWLQPGLLNRTAMALCRASTSCPASAGGKAWMAGPSPAMRIKEGVRTRHSPEFFPRTTLAFAKMANERLMSPGSFGRSDRGLLPESGDWQRRTRGDH